MIRALVASLLLAVTAGTALAGSSLDDPDITVGKWSRGQVPLCDEPSVINNIAHRYEWANSKTWQTGLSIGEVSRIDETGFAPGNPGLLDRRFCHAKVQLSNGHPAELFYLIEERQGFASIGWGVEFCVPGQDPWRVYDGGCRAIRWQ